MGTRDTGGLGEGQDAGLGEAPAWWVQVINVSGEDSCIGLGDKGLGLIPGNRQHGGLVASVEQAGEEASDWESTRKTEGQH